MLSHLQNFVALSFSVLIPFAPSPERPTAAPSGTDDFQARCKAFQPETFLTDTTTRGVAYIPANTNLSLKHNDPSCNRPHQVVPVDICRVAVSIATSQNSSVDVEAWLPRNWTEGRILGTGNGGLGGCVQYEDLAYGSQHGFATIGSNNGHDGNTATPFYQNSDVAVDFAWRALHTSVVNGKGVVKHFYGHPHTRSYYIGCSTGGRQGINAADRFPEEFDGIVVGAPAVDFNNLTSWRASFFPTTGPASAPDFITPETWSGIIHDDVLRQCDDIDGVQDGIIEDPSLCDFGPETLRCTSDADSECLSPSQVDVVRKVFSPLYGADGGMIYPAMQPGSELAAAEGLYAGKPFRYSEEWFKYVVYGDPSWDPSTFSIQDAAMADSLNPGGVRTWPDDLSKFRDRNGKLLVYHGGQDNKITGFNTERFYEHLAQKMQMRPDQLDGFLRFFRIFGMSHCHSGPGAWVLGQGGGSSSADGVPFARDKNVLAAVVDWVEEGIAPETIDGAKFVDDRRESGVSLRRKHCRYPWRNVFQGGDSASPRSWQCQKGGAWR